MIINSIHIEENGVKRFITFQIGIILFIVMQIVKVKPRY